LSTDCLAGYHPQRLLKEVSRTHQTILIFKFCCGNIPNKEAGGGKTLLEFEILAMMKSNEDGVMDIEKRRIELELQLLNLQEQRIAIEEKRIELELRKLKLFSKSLRKSKSKRSLQGVRPEIEHPSDQNTSSEYQDYEENLIGVTTSDDDLDFDDDDSEEEEIMESQERKEKKKQPKRESGSEGSIVYSTASKRLGMKPGFKRAESSSSVENPIPPIKTSKPSSRPTRKSSVDVMMNENDVDLIKRSTARSRSRIRKSDSQVDVAKLQLAISSSDTLFEKHLQVAREAAAVSSSRILQSSSSSSNGSNLNSSKHEAVMAVSSTATTTASNDTSRRRRIGRRGSAPFDNNVTNYDIDEDAIIDDPRSEIMYRQVSLRKLDVVLKRDAKRPPVTNRLGTNHDELDDSQQSMDGLSVQTEKISNKKPGNDFHGVVMNPM
jgi:hypothetical protein